MLAVAASLAGCGRRKGSRFPGFAYIANQAGHSVAAIDLSDFVVARRIPIEAAPSQVIAAGRRVFVLAPAAGVVYELNATSILRRARVARSAVSMRLAPDGDALWVLTNDPPGLVSLDLAALAPRARVRLPAAPRDFDLDRQGKHAAAVDSAISVADLKTGAIYRVEVTRHARLVRFRRDWEPAALIIADAADRSIVMAGLKSGRALARLPLPLEPAHFCMKSDGGELFVSGPGMDAVVAVYPFSTEIGETLLAGRAPGEMAISTAPEYLFVTNPGSGDVTILDLATRKLAGVATVGHDPGGILFTPDQQYALVLNRQSGDVAVLRMSMIRPQRRKTAPLFTMIPVGARPVSGAVAPA
jgi:YVTN family beta-propeller protein